MSRFFFHVHDSISFLDEEGTELPDLKAAREQAIITAGSILRENPDHLWAGNPWRMEVADEGGHLLFTLHFALQKAAPES
jgi:hypothetical protein